MTIALLILSILLWASSIALLFLRRQILAPAASYLALLSLSFAGTAEQPLLPINSTMLIAWLCMVLIVMAATFMQPVAIQQQTRGMGYMVVGAFTGMAVGLLGVSFSANISMLYGIMIVAIALGIFFSFLLFSNTPKGKDVGLGSGHFMQYLTAKGFPAAITIMIIGMVLVLALYLHNLPNPGS